MLQAICAASIAMVPRRSRGRTAAAPGVAAPAGGGEHGRGQRFLQRRLALVLAPAALEQRLARGVDVQRAHAFRRGAHRCRSGRWVSTLGRSPVVAERRNGVLDPQRGEVQALQRAVLRRHLDLEASRCGVNHSPGHAAGERRTGRSRCGRACGTASPARAAPAGCAGSGASASRLSRRAATPPRARRRPRPAGSRRARSRREKPSTPAAQGRNSGKRHQRQCASRAPCASWPARCAAPRGTWRRCGARTRCPAP